LVIPQKAKAPSQSLPRDNDHIFIQFFNHRSV
jgi:hypothetical protein